MTRAREKASLLRKADSPIFRSLLHFIYSPTVTFGVGAVCYYDDVEPSSLAPEPYACLSLMRQLHERALTGTAAKRAVSELIESYPHAYRSMLRDIFAQRLALGINVKGINKVLPGVIPEFGVQLAKEYDPELHPLPAWVSAKLDGMRCLAIHDTNGVALLSRTGKPIEGVPHIADAIATCPHGVYDGELLHPGGFQVTVSVCRHSTTLHPNYSEVTFNVFDYVPLNEWNNPTTPANERFFMLRAALRVAPPELRLVEHELVKDSLELLRTHQDYVSRGYEGTMIQSNAPYQKKRTNELTKLKDFLSTEARVVEWLPGDSTSKWRDCMGRLVCIDTKSGMEFRVGSGFTEAERQITDGWVGKVIEVKFQEWTDPDADGNVAPRFPTFLRVREDLS